MSAMRLRGVTPIAVAESARGSIAESVSWPTPYGNEPSLQRTILSRYDSSPLSSLNRYGDCNYCVASRNEVIAAAEQECQQNSTADSAYE